MGKIYHVDGYLEPMVAVLRDTLIYCDGSLRVEQVEDGTRELVVEIEVEGEGAGTPVITAKGTMRSLVITFRSGAERSSFSVESDDDDAEDAFHEFAMRLNFFRKSKRLPPLDYNRFYDIDREEVPPLTADNYSLFQGAYLDKFLDLLDKKTRGISIWNTGGKYSIIRYSENARITKYLCRENIPVYQSFLEDFRRFYGFTDAAFVFCRRGKEQHVFFHVKGKGLYHNTQDKSLEFMEDAYPYMEMLLDSIQDYLLEGREWWEDSKPVYEYRPDKTGKRYTLYFNDMPTEMLINAVSMMGPDSLRIMADLARNEEPSSVSGSTKTYTGVGLPPPPNVAALFPGMGQAIPNSAKPNLPPPYMNRGPIIWVAEGGDGGKTMRPYLTLNTAIKKELGYVDRIFKSGNIATIVKS
ncbi:MAG: hypothetical protein LBD86_03195 [Spirochaetaceae bacterium]|jgi:hypothetical protein|nr:hypothetical protein [Spirochaetaceae bacterium]